MNTQSYLKTTMDSFDKNTTTMEDTDESLSMSFGTMTMPVWLS